MKFPVWIDLKGQDSVPDTVHHVVCRVNPISMSMWKNLSTHWTTDGVHEHDVMNTQQPSKGMLSTCTTFLLLVSTQYDIYVIAINCLKYAVCYDVS